MLLLSATMAYAGDTTIRQSFFKNSGGLNDKANPIAINDDQASDLQNVVFDTDGSISKRKGYSKFNTTPIPGNEGLVGLYYFRQSDGDDWLVATTTNQNVYTSTNLSGTFTRITGTASWTSGQNVLSSFDTAQDILLFEDGDSSTPPWKWDPDGTVKQVVPLSGSPANGTIVKYFKNHVFIANLDNSTLSFSNLGAIQSYDPRDAIEVQTNDGSGITSMWVQLDGLYVGKRNAIFRLDGTSRSDFILQKLIEGVGPTNHQSVQVIDNKCYFVATNGNVYIYDGGITAERLSDRITTTISGFNQSRSVFAVSGIRDREYWTALTSSGGSTHNRILVYDPTTDSWTKFVGINANAMSYGYDINDVQHLYSGGYNGIVYKQRDTEADDGQAILSYWTSKMYHFNEIPNEKILRRILLVTDVDGSWPLTVEVLSDFQSSGTVNDVTLSAGTSLWNSMVWDTDTWGGTTVFTTKIPFQTDKIAEFFQIKFSNNGASQPWTVRGYSMDVDRTGRP